VTASTPFDGQYLQPNASNSAVEWWWAQAIGTPVDANPPPAFQLLFYEGYPFQVGPRDPSLPEFYIVINGFFPNGTQFALTIPASSATVTASGQTVAGVWGDVASFKGSPDISTWTATFTAPAYGLEGIFRLTSNAPHHFGCNSTTDPYFTSAVAGQTLSDAETVLYEELGWATSIPGGRATVDMVIDGSPLKINGFGYHDANWSPQPINALVSTWQFGSAQAGPYDLSYISVTPVNSTKILNTGFLSRNGVILQNQCSLQGTKSNDHSIVTPYGVQHDTVAGVDVPAGYIIGYILENGEKFSFNLTAEANAQNPDVNVYHRWVGTVTGGEVGGTQYSGLTVFEWLNPGLATYTPPE